MAKLERHTEALSLLATLAGIAAVAYADSLVVSISLGYLYVLPLSLSALTQRLRATLVLTGICVALHDWLGPYEHTGWQVAYRSLLTSIGFVTVVLFVSRLAGQRTTLLHIVRSQRDEIALELQYAADVQQRLLPRQPPEVPGYEFAGLMSPAKQLGGDYYDYISLPGGNVGLVIADVSGKGAEAALFMPSVEVALRMDRTTSLQTADVILELNRVLCELAEQTHYVTLFYAKLDVASRTLHYTNAGHFPPLLLRGGGEELWLTEGGPPVGLLSDASYQTTSIRLLPGDALVLYTDGITDAENAGGESFSAKRLASIARTSLAKSAQGMIEAIQKSLESFVGRRELSDDLTLVVLKAAQASADPPEALYKPN